MKHLKTNKELIRVNLFKEKYKEKDYIGAAYIVLSGWGTNEPSLSEYELKLIDDIIILSTKNEQEQYDIALRCASGTFG